MTDPVDAAYPFRGRWLVQNSAAERVPSHGTDAFASAYAIDFVPVDAAGRSAPVRWSTLVRPEPPERFPGFGRPVLAPVAGTVVAVLDEVADHAAFRGLPSVAYALTQARRARGGWLALAGNHVMIQTAAGTVVAVCHLRYASTVVRLDDRVSVGEPIAACGSTGNSTEPHVHVQAMDGPDPATARALPLRFDGELPRNGTVVER